MGVVVRAEQEKMYAAHKAEMKDWAEKSGIAKDRRELRERARQIHGHIASSVERAIVAYVNERYSRWRDAIADMTKADFGFSLSEAKRALPEPSLSLGDIVAGIDSTLSGWEISYAKERYSIVNSALRRLVKQGKLKSSLGWSKLARGRKSETRMYEPGEG